MNHWPTSKRIRFVFSYAWAKLRLIYDIRNPKLSFFIFEWRYSLANLLNSFKPGLCAQVMYHGPAQIQTRHETFEVRRGTQDAAIVSPAFERADLQHLYALAKMHAAQGSLDFIDVGANIGQFCVRLPRRLVGADLKIWAFEPVPQNIAQLELNLKTNSIAGVKVFPVALSDREARMPMRFDVHQAGDSSLLASANENSIEVQVKRADDVMADLRPNSARLIKIDVEGHEAQVLGGMKKIFSEGRSIDLCIEDIFDREKLYSLLESMGFEFQAKFTPYNSFWRRSRRA